MDTIRGHFGGLTLCTRYESACFFSQFCCSQFQTQLVAESPKMIANGVARDRTRPLASPHNVNAGFLTLDGNLGCGQYIPRRDLALAFL